MQPQKEVSIILIVRVFDNFLILWNYGIGWHIQKEQDEKFNVHLLKISLLVQNGSKM